jgi:predicted transcriptional regulator
MPRLNANREVSAVPAQLAESFKVLLVILSDSPIPMNIEDLANQAGLTYHTCRNRLLKLLDLGLIKKDSPPNTRPTTYSTYLSEVEAKEIATSLATDLVIRNKEVDEKPSPHENNTLAGQPLEAWLKGYAQKDDRTTNIKEKADLFPCVIAQLFKIAYTIDPNEKLWAVQDRITETKTLLKEIITTYARLITVARELFNMEPVWDARTIRDVLRHDGLTIEQALELVSAVAANYRRPYVGSDEGGA